MRILAIIFAPENFSFYPWRKMTYKTYAEQLIEHLKHLQSHGFYIHELKVDSTEWIRCHAIGKSTGRGELAYITNTEKLNNGLLGIRTSFRGLNGIGSYRTYGHYPNGNEVITSFQNSCNVQKTKVSNDLHVQAANKAYGFWKHSNITGVSDYLNKKGVGSYGIRFRQGEQYGNVAVIPMFDEMGRLWNYQILNPDGTKRHPKDARIEGLFHKLQEPVNRKPIGIAESYVTSATCFELSGIPVLCAFSSENLNAVTKVILSLFPASPIIIFSDNDRHLIEKGIPNKGLLKAQEAKKLCEGRVVLVTPDFACIKPSKESSDWNDLVRIKGYEFTKAQMSEMLISYRQTSSLIKL